MTKKLLIINAVGLTKSLITEHSQWLQEYVSNQNITYLTPPIPAVTCTSQTTILTGLNPSEHGIVANGWYFRDVSQIHLWKQSNKLVSGQKIWEKIKAKDPNFKTANMFWWYNMYSTVDFSITPRPLYRSDGLKIPESYSYPPDLKEKISEKLGAFPLFKFWGPMTSIQSTEWIGKSTEYIIESEQPNLVLSYLPHLDYNLQRVGPHHPDIKKDVLELEGVIKSLIEKAQKFGYEIVLLSEYGIQEVDTPIHINRILRENGYITPTIELGEEHPDVQASRAFALADHQIAHIYIRDDSDIQKVKKLLSNVQGIDKILDKEEQKSFHLNHQRSGELIALSKRNAWFTYYYWLDDQKAPDFAKTVDIHKKPGYDPVELFVDKNGKLKAMIALLKKKLGFRYLLNVIPLDANLVKGSHGVLTDSKQDGPLLVSSSDFCKESELEMRHVFDHIHEWFS